MHCFPTGRGRSLVLLAASLCAAASAQRIARKDNIANLAARLDPRPGDKSLTCEIQPIHPALNFGFRYQAGYFFGVRLSEFDGRRHRWTALTHITPEQSNAEEFYLIASGRFPAAPKDTHLNPRLKAQAGGAFWLGEGRYKVKWLLQDDLGRVCRKEWNIEARLGHNDRKIKLTVVPNTVEALSWKGFSNQEQPSDDTGVSRLTVLLDAAPRRVRRNSPANLSFADELQLVGAMAELLHDIPSRWVRVVAFSLDQQKEVFRRDEFRMDDIDQLAEALNGLRLGQVDSSVLRDAGGRVRLLSGILNREISDPDPASMVILLGPEERYGDKMPVQALSDPAPAGPRFFYVQCKPAPMLATLPGFDLGRGGAVNGAPSEFVAAPSSFSAQSNLIQSAVKRLQGESFVVYTPGQFAKAVERIQREARR
ncbi:MAG: hypothetical protein JO307_16275 [Bryobacterales bacterium]|nr:hypothetical protein [Bryobacterales bacterium]